MYIIYCKHIFVYIFLVILTEILVLLLRFFQEKKNSPLQTEALCYSFVSERHSRCKKDCSYWFTLRTIGKGRIPNVDVPKLDRPLWWIHQLAQSTGEEDFQVSGWVPFKMAWKADPSPQKKKNKQRHALKLQLLADVLSLPWTRVQPVESLEANQGLWSWRGCWSLSERKKTTIWKVAQTSCCRKPVSCIHTKCFFFF